MIHNQPKKEVRTDTYYNGINRLLCASYWVDELGNEKKIPQGLKLYYLYRLNNYNLFVKLDCTYFEKHTTVAKVLGLSVDTIKRTYNPMLKAMGLIETKGSFQDNDITYIVNDFSCLNGWLVNYELVGCKVNKKDYQRDESFTYDNLKVLEHNKRVAKNIRTDSTVKYSSIPQEKLRELLQAERELKQLKGSTEE